MTGSGGMTILFYKGLTRNPGFRNTLAKFCPIPRHWGKLGIQNLAWMSLIKSYWMLQNVSVTAFIVSGLLREKQQGVKITHHLNEG